MKKNMGAFQYLKTGEVIGKWLSIKMTSEK